MKLMSLTPKLGAGLLSGMLLFSSACSAPQSGTSPTNKEATKVVVAFYPYEFAAQKILGQAGSVTNLTSPGGEPHDLELTPKQIAAIGDADLVIYQSGFQAAVDEAIKQNAPKHVLDISKLVTFRDAPPSGDQPASADGGENHEEEDFGGLDPHIWLDFDNMIKAADAITTQLSDIKPDQKAEFESRNKALKNDLTKLDADFKTGLATCKIDTIVVNHEAFGYLAARYNMNQVGIAGLDPEIEPSPARIAAVQEAAKKHKVTTIFYEANVSPKVASTMAHDLNLKTAVLDPLETLSDKSKGKDYIEVMHSDLETLRAANQCQ